MFSGTLSGTVQLQDTVHIYYLAMEIRAFAKAMGTGAMLIRTIMLIVMLISIVSRCLTAKPTGEITRV